jgi:hypothetical protein
MDGEGAFIITWASESNVLGQRYSSDGNPMGNNFMVNDDEGSAISYANKPKIAMDESGNHVITWVDFRNSNFDIYAQRYTNEGEPIGINFKVNDDDGEDFQHNPSISSDGNGNFVITWWQDRDYQYHFDIMAQRYASDGTPLGGNFKVNEENDSFTDNHPTVASDHNGNFIITWWEDHNEYGKVFAQRYSSDGSKMGDNLEVTDRGGYPNVKLFNNHIYMTWSDDRKVEGTFDIWGNLLKWNNPVGLNGEDIIELPSVYKLNQNFPNPFNPTTAIGYQLSAVSDVELTIYNLVGQRVTTLVYERQQAGNHQVEWDASGFASGIYYYRIEAGEFVDVKKMIYIK